MFKKLRLKEHNTLKMQLELMTIQFNNHLKWSAQALSPELFKDEIIKIEAIIEDLSIDIDAKSNKDLKRVIEHLENRLHAFEIAFNDEKNKIGKQPGFHRGMARIELKSVENEIKDVYIDFLSALDPKDAYSAQRTYQGYLKHLTLLTQETYKPEISNYNYFKVEMEKIKSDSFDYINNFKTV